MITRTQDVQKNQPLNLEAAVDTTKLKENTSLIGKFKARGAISRANAAGFVRAETALADARSNVAITAVGIAEAQIRSALVGAAMPRNWRLNYPAQRGYRRCRPSAYERCLRRGLHTPLQSRGKRRLSQMTSWAPAKSTTRNEM